MKKIGILLTLIVFSVVLLLNNTSLADNAVENADQYCEIGLNVNDKLKDVNISHEKKDLNGASIEWNTLNYQYVRLVYTGMVDNTEGTIKKGDYVTLKLDPKININGVVDQKVALMSNWKDPEGNVFAVYTYDDENDTIKYVFTEQIEKYKKVDFKFVEVDFPNYEELLNNGEYTFTHQLGNVDYSYTYDVVVGWNMPERPHNKTQNGKGDAQVESSVFITKTFPLEKRYEQISYNKFYDTEGKEIQMKFDDPSEEQEPEIKIYALPAGENLPHSYGIDVTKLNDVTDTFYKEVNGRTTIFKKINDNTENYVVVINNELLPETVPYLSVAFRAQVPSSPHAQEHVEQGNPHLAWVGAESSLRNDTIYAEARAYINRIPTPCSDPREYDVKISKIAEDTKKYLAGANLSVFKIFNGQSTLVESWDTEETEKSMTLKNGTYKLKENTAPSAYQLAEDIDFTISKEGILTIHGKDGEIVAEKLSVKMIDKLKQYQVKILKVDKDDHNIKLANVKFALKDDKNNVVDTVKTNSEGEAIFKNVPYGKYTLVELETITGYELSKKEVKVDLVDDKYDIDLGIFENEKTPVHNPPSGGGTPNTGGGGGTPNNGNPPNKNNIPKKNEEPKKNDIPNKVDKPSNSVINKKLPQTGQNISSYKLMGISVLTFIIGLAFLCRKDGVFID